MRIGITGISGSLGTALVDRFERDHVIVGITRDELKAEKVMAGRENVRCMVVAAGLDDRDAMRRAFDGCELIIHAAALKRISGSVYAAQEIVKTNIVGTQNVLQVARDLGVERVVVVSSDKAVEATNLYGSSKFCAECLAVQENSFSYPKGSSIVIVRYGNVLGSRGSVVHIWREQLRRSGRVMLTDRHMTRFIMGMNEAVDAIEYAAQSADAGEIVVPLLRSARVIDLAFAVMRQTGYLHGGIDEIGLRPGGEKVHESLLSQEEIMRARYAPGGDPYLLIQPSHATWTAKKKGLAFFDQTSYSSATSERFTVDELVEKLANVPNRPPND